MQEPDLSSLFFFVLSALPLTLQLTAHALAWGFVIGLIMALIRVYGGSGLRWIAIAYEKVLRGVPLLVWMFIFALGTPQLFLIFPPLLRSLAAVLLALAIRSGAFQSQIFRGALLSVSSGQMTAARALGMNRLQAFRNVIIPQALRIALPGWTNEYAIILKDTSFAFVLGIPELTRAAQVFGVTNPAFLFPSQIIVALLYFVVTFPVTQFLGERQTRRLKKLGLGG